MAVSEHQVEILRGSQSQGRFRERVDVERDDDLRRVLYRWLEDNRIDEDFWEQYKITVLTHTRLIEVTV